LNAFNASQCLAGTRPLKSPDISSFFLINKKKQESFAHIKRIFHGDRKAAICSTTHIDPPKKTRMSEKSRKDVSRGTRRETPTLRWLGPGKAEGRNVLLRRPCLFSRNFSKSFVYHAAAAAVAVGLAQRGYIRFQVAVYVACDRSGTCYSWHRGTLERCWNTFRIFGYIRYIRLLFLVTWSSTTIVVWTIDDRSLSIERSWNAFRTFVTFGYYF